MQLSRGPLQPQYFNYPGQLTKFRNSCRVNCLKCQFHALTFTCFFYFNVCRSQPYRSSQRSRSITSSSFAKRATSGKPHETNHSAWTFPLYHSPLSSNARCNSFSCTRPTNHYFGVSNDSWLSAFPVARSPGRNFRFGNLAWFGRQSHNRARGGPRGYTRDVEWDQCYADSSSRDDSGDESRDPG